MYINKFYGDGKSSVYAEQEVKNVAKEMILYYPVTNNGINWKQGCVMDSDEFYAKYKEKEMSL